MIAFETISSTAWVRSYRPSKGITYPMAFDSTKQVSALYRVGAAYGNIVPSLLLVDKKGLVRFRTDGKFNQVVPLSDKITELLAEP
jgi:alkyl hydroperoxide reductase subunit AhpC